jgi:hypothetical protein
MCEDCGIPPWSDCVCDPDAGIDHPRLSVVTPERRDGWEIRGAGEHPNALGPCPLDCGRITLSGGPCEACTDFANLTEIASKPRSGASLANGSLPRSHAPVEDPQRTKRHVSPAIDVRDGGRSLGVASSVEPSEFPGVNGGSALAPKASDPDVSPNGAPKRAVVADLACADASAAPPGGNPGPSLLGPAGGSTRSPAASSRHPFDERSAA